MSAYDPRDPKHPGYAERMFDRADPYRDDARTASAIVEPTEPKATT